MRRWILPVVLLFVASACSPGDIELALDQFPSQNLSQSNDPGERAAGESAIEVLLIREAEEKLDKAVADRDLSAIHQAQRLRPSDPKYDMYESALLAGESREGEQGIGVARGHDAANRAAAEKLAAARPDLSSEERGRLSTEMYIDALREVIRATSRSPERDQTIQIYCAYIQSWYPQYWTDRYPSDVAFFLALQNFTVCPD